MEDPRTLSPPELRAWLAARLAGRPVGPPVCDHCGEAPEDHVVALAGDGPPGFRARLALAVVRLLWAPVGPAALGALGSLAARLDLAPAVGPLALRAFAPSGDGGARLPLLAALARLQPPRALWGRWLALWAAGDAGCAAVATAGLRRSDPGAAPALLSAFVARGAADPALALGEILWAYGADRRLAPGAVAEALGALAPEARARAREALRAVGARRADLTRLGLAQ